MTKNQKILILLYVLVAITTAYISCLDGGDFDVYLNAGHKLLDKQNIYGDPLIKGQDKLQYFYSNFFALLLSPFSQVVFVTEFIWIILTYALLARTAQIICYFFDIQQLTAKQIITWGVATILLSLQFMTYEIALIQVTTFMMWSILESLYQIKQNRPILAGLFLGIAINIKIIPVVVLPYLFYRGHFKTLATCVVVFISLLYLPSLFIGWDYNSFLLSEWWKVINPINKEHMFETGIGGHSIVSWLPVFLTPTEGEMPYQRHLFHLSHSTVELVTNLVRIFFFSLSIFFLRSLPFKKETTLLKVFWECAYFIVLIPLLLPHQQKYEFMLALPMISYIIYVIISRAEQPKSKFEYAMLALFFVSILFYSPLYSSDIIGRFLFRFTQHYRLLTFATIFIIPVALYYSPSKLVRGTQLQ